MNISVIIITYKRHNDVLEAVHSVLNQAGHFETIVIDNDPQSTLYSLLPIQNDLKYYRMRENRGVAGGRNAGIKHANGDVFLFLDDDAVMATENALLKIKKYLKEHGKIGCLAFRIENYYSRQVNAKEFPHPDSRLVDKTMKVSYFLGGANAIRKSVFDKTGPFMDLMYWGEELELSFRMIKNGFEILYTPDIVVYHKASLTGRFTQKKQLYYCFRNRFYVLTPHLPLRYLLINLTLWSGYWFIQAIKMFALKEYFFALKDGIQKGGELYKNHRNPISERALHYLKKHGGRLWC